MNPWINSEKKTQQKKKDKCVYVSTMEFGLGGEGAPNAKR